MAGICDKNTKPEIIVRKSLHQRGFRYTLHQILLPGKPALVLPKYHTVVLVMAAFGTAMTANYSSGQKQMKNSGKIR